MEGQTIETLDLVSEPEVSVQEIRKMVSPEGVCAKLDCVRINKKTLQETVSHLEDAGNPSLASVLGWSEARVTELKPVIGEVLENDRLLDILARAESGTLLSQEATVALDAFPEEKFTGKISKVNFEAITTKGGGTAFVTEVLLPENTDLRFKIGLNGEMEVATAKRENVLVVPSEAVYAKNGTNYVKVLADDKVSEVAVTTGLETDQEIEILTGLTSGQKVITSEKK